MRDEKLGLAQVMVLGALSLLCVAPSRSFMVPVQAKGPPSPLLASTASGGRIDTVGGCDDTADVRLGVSVVKPSPVEDQRLQAPGVATSLAKSPSGALTSGKLQKSPQLVHGETAARSFVKALMWRLTAAVVTLLSGLVFSRSLTTALGIVGSDFLTKSGFMFLGERLWNRVKWGQGKSGDSTQRSLAKAVLWRLFAASNTLVCGIFLARDLSVASKIAGADTLFKTGLFFVNERLWSTIKWGKTYEPDCFISWPSSGDSKRRATPAASPAGGVDGVDGGRRQSDWSRRMLG